MGSLGRYGQRSSPDVVCCYGEDAKTKNNEFGRLVGNTGNPFTAIDCFSAATARLALPVCASISSDNGFLDNPVPPAATGWIMPTVLGGVGVLRRISIQ